MYHKILGILTELVPEKEADEVARMFSDMTVPSGNKNVTSDAVVSYGDNDKHIFEGNV